MLSRWARRWSGKIFGPLLFVLERAGVTPNQLSLASLAVTAAAGLLFARGNLAAGAWLFLLGGLLDFAGRGAGPDPPARDPAGCIPGFGLRPSR